MMAAMAAEALRNHEERKRKAEERRAKAAAKAANKTKESPQRQKRGAEEAAIADQPSVKMQAVASAANNPTRPSKCKAESPPAHASSIGMDDVSAPMRWPSSSAGDPSEKVIVVDKALLSETCSGFALAFASPRGSDESHAGLGYLLAKGFPVGLGATTEEDWQRFIKLGKEFGGWDAMASSEHAYAK